MRAMAIFLPGKASSILKMPNMNWTKALWMMPAAVNAAGNFSKAYLRHLFKADEMLGMRLAVMHNLYFYNTLMEKIRAALDEGRFEAFYKQYVQLLDTRI